MKNLMVRYMIQGNNTIKYNIISYDIIKNIKNKMFFFTIITITITIAITIAITNYNNMSL